MFRRRRRRSSFSARHPERRWILMGVGGAALIGLFIYFMGEADRRAPAQHEVRIELPNAFGTTP